MKCQGTALFLAKLAPAGTHLAPGLRLVVLIAQDRSRRKLLLSVLRGQDSRHWMQMFLRSWLRFLPFRESLPPILLWLWRLWIGPLHGCFWRAHSMKL